MEVTAKQAKTKAALSMVLGQGLASGHPGGNSPQVGLNQKAGCWELAPLVAATAVVNFRPAAFLLYGNVGIAPALRSFLP